MEKWHILETRAAMCELCERSLLHKRSVAISHDCDGVDSEIAYCEDCIANMALALKGKR